MPGTQFALGIITITIVVVAATVMALISTIISVVTVHRVIHFCHDQQHFLLLSSLRAVCALCSLPALWLPSARAWTKHEQ